MTSDGETATIPCQLNGQVIADPASGTFHGTAVLQSGDGTTNGTFILTPTSVANTYTLTGKATENDTPDPGQPPQSYPCKVRGKLVATPQPNGTFVLAGGLTMLEGSTAP